MAREIVITSVPRGVKLGRTGFQVAMQTAGLRDDLATVLEKMAGYRHLPAGGGANPVSYFHRPARTIAGQMSVIGRIVDAGVDFSNRSNKLAHMVVLEPADLGVLASSSPAAALAAIEPRLAATWPGGPEERQMPFSLAGIPPAQPAVCFTWQQVMGDAGWAGVIAERATHGQPTLIVGPDPSPASCRRMLTLFQEALAIVPPGKRWAVTFDTTTLAPDGILWRGTYAGSPESQATQPGLLVIDLARPQPIPANMAVGDLVQAARTGQGPAAMPLPSRPGGPAAAGPGVTTGAGGVPGGPAVNAATGPAGPRPPVPIGGLPPTPPGGGNDWDDIPSSGPGRRSSGGLIAAGIAVAVIALLAAVGVGGFFAWQAMSSGRALNKVRDYADSNEAKYKPSDEELLAALGLDGRAEPTRTQAEQEQKHLPFLLAVLESPEVEGESVKDADGLKEVLRAVKAIQSRKGQKNAEDFFIIRPGLNRNAVGLLTALHPEPFNNYDEFRTLTDACSELVALAGKPTDQRVDAAIDDQLWGMLVKAASVSSRSRDYEAARSRFTQQVVTGDVASHKALIEALQKAAPETKPADGAAPGPTQTAGGGKPGPGPQQSKPGPPTSPADDPEQGKKKAFDALVGEIAKFRKADPKGKVSWPPDPTNGTKLFAIPADVAKDLDAEVVVGTSPGLDVRAEQEGRNLSWLVKSGGHHVFTVALSGGEVVIRRPNVSPEEWKKYESSPLRFMPIAFRRPGQPVGKDHWIVLAKPTPATLKAESTLWDLLCGEAGSVPLPAGLAGSGPLLWRKPFQVEGLPLSLATVPDPVGTVRLEFTARIAGRDYTLSEPLEVKGDAVRRVRGAWRDRKGRQGSLLTKVRSKPGPTGPEELSAIGFKPGKEGEITAAEIPQTGYEDKVRGFVAAVLDEGFRQEEGSNFTKPALAAWSPPVSGSRTEFDTKAHKTLEDWRNAAREYVQGAAGFKATQEGAFEQRGSKPQNPGEFKPPERQKDEKDDAYEKRIAPERKKHQEEKKRWDDWLADRDEFVAAAAANPDILRKYLAEHAAPGNGKPWEDDKKKQPEIDPELAAIHLLLELDGVVVAKVRRAELEQLLQRVPVAALFEGSSSREWDLPGLGKVSVPEAVITAAAIEPALPAAATPPAGSPPAATANPAPAAAEASAAGNPGQ